MNVNIEDFPEVRKRILLLLKQGGGMTINQLAERLGVSYEAIRQQIKLLEGEDLIERRRASGTEYSQVGRPKSYYRIKPEGDHIFPKNYDALAIEIIDTLAEQLGAEALRNVLASLTEARVKKWQPVLEGLALSERVKALKDIYLEEDPFTVVHASGGEISLVERNCPFLNVAMERPQLCSVTVSTLMRLLGYRVKREKRFQDGDGRCVFRLLTDQPIDAEAFRFEFESPAD